MEVSPRLVLSNKEIHLGAHFQQQEDRFCPHAVDQTKTVFVWDAETDVSLAKAGPPSGVLGSLASRGVLRDGDHAGTRTQAPPPELEPRAQEAGEATPASPSHPSAP